MEASISSLDFQPRALAAQAFQAKPPIIAANEQYRVVKYITYEEDGKVKELHIPTYSFRGMTDLSLSQISLMVTLERANEMEGRVISTMETIAKNNVQLELINKVTEQLAKLSKGESSKLTQQISYQSGLDENGNVVTTTKQVDEALVMLGILDKTEKDKSYSYDTCLGYYNELKTKLDELNSLNQEEMINLQSFLNKRDQAYELGSNINKLFFAGFMSIARNM